MQSSRAAEIGQERATAREEASTSGREQAPCYVILHNVSKRHNIGTLARSATAFGVTEVKLACMHAMSTAKCS